MSRLRRRRYVRRDGDGLAPVVSLTPVTGYWCAACHLPRIPAEGDDGMHPACWNAEVARRVRAQRRPQRAQTLF